MSRKILVVCTLLCALAGAVMAQTSTTGAISGRIVEAGGGPLPGVTVEVRSPSLQGARVEVTGSNGEFRFGNLPPGQYSLSASLTGFGPLRQNDIAVPLGRTVSVELEMKVTTIAETITVTAAAPVVDVTSTSTGANITSETMEALPLPRDFYAVAQVAPGTSTDGAGTTFYGSTGAENQYVIDGLNTTGVELGTEAKTLNFDFIQEVEVLTGGLPAEYGRLTGGVINAITKSGGNEFTGDVFAFGSGGGMRSDNSTAPDRPEWSTTITATDEEFDYGFDLGGYLVRDRIWFFGAYNRINETDIDTRIQPVDLGGGLVLPAGFEVANETTSDVFAGKLTFRLNDQHNLAFSAFGDPSTAEGAQFALAGPPSTYEGTRERGGTDLVLRYNGLLGSTFTINALAGQHRESDETTGPGASITQVIDQRVTPNVITGGFGFFQNQEFNRDTYKLDLGTYFGNHQIKFGGDIEQLSAVNANWNGGAGQRIYLLCAEPDTRAGNEGLYRSGCGRDSNTANDVTFYRHRYYVPFDTFDIANKATWTLLAPLTVEPETENTSLYAQDSWRVLPNFTVNAGLRLETQEIMGASGDTQIKIDDNLSPRVGVIWDVLNNGRSKLYANYGRFYESVPMDINIRAFGGEISVLLHNYGNNLTDLPACAVGETNPVAAGCIPLARSGASGTGRVYADRSLGGHTTPVDPDLKGQYIDEYLIGYEQEIANNFSVGVKGTFRNLGRAIEDFLIVDLGDYFIANPGSGIGSTLTMYDYSTVPAPEAKREYTGVELSAKGRVTPNVQLFASYLWSRLEGNYDGVFQVATGQLDPNINSAFDYGDFLVNADGPLSNDRTHQFKVYGAYTVPTGAMTGLNLGLSAYWESGTPLTAYGYSFGYQNWEYYLTERGALGRGPSDYEADLHVGYPVRFGGVEANFLLDVFNVLDRQGVTRLDQRYNLASHGVCGGFDEALCNGDGGLLNVAGTLQPLGSIGDARANSPNPDFLEKGTNFTAPRSIRLGVRLSF